MSWSVSAFLLAHDQEAFVGLVGEVLDLFVVRGAGIRGVADIGRCSRLPWVGNAALHRLDDLGLGLGGPSSLIDRRPGGVPTVGGGRVWVLERGCPRVVLGR